MRYLPTHEAQARVLLAEYKKLEPWQERLWFVLLTACGTPGLPVEDPRIQQQCAAIWGRNSSTYRHLVTEERSPGV